MFYVKIQNFCFIGYIILLFTSCLPLLNWHEGKLIDYSPPVLQNCVVLDSNNLRVDFDESVIADKKGIICTPNLDFEVNSYSRELDDEMNSLLFEFSTAMVAGEEYLISFTLKDNCKNQLSLMLSFYGYNANLPTVVLNEIRLEGSSSRPDLLELYCKSSGNIAGLTFCRGVSSDCDFLYIFPSLEVEQGDYILLHVKPDGITEEVNELSSKSVSGGKEASDNAWDFWLEFQNGLSATNGVLSLYNSPGGNLEDCFVYSNRTSLSDTKYGGFGTSTNQYRANNVAELNHWFIVGDTIIPEDCFNPVDGTSTRTLCRNSTSSDSNKKIDWHIVPTGECTFGYKNCDEIYEN